MTPMGNAVGFVDGQQSNFQLPQKTPEIGQNGAFRGHVEDSEPAITGQLFDSRDLLRGQGAVDEAGSDAIGDEAVHLVFHQGNEGRDH